MKCLPKKCRTGSNRHFAMFADWEIQIWTWSNIEQRLSDDNNKVERRIFVASGVIDWHCVKFIFLLTQINNQFPQILIQRQTPQTKPRARQGCVCVIGNWVNTLQDIFDTRASISRLSGIKTLWLQTQLTVQCFCTLRVLTTLLYNLQETRVKMTGEEATKSQPPSFVRQLFVCGTIFTLSMSIGAGAGFSGVVIPQV